MSKRASCREIESVIGESPFQFKELVVHILCQICTTQVNGKVNAVTVLRLRGVNHTFRDEIDTSLLLWRFIMRFTRRAMIEPPVPIPINTISEIREFIILDSKEFILREYLICSRPRDRVGWLVDRVDSSTFDYREVFIAVRLLILGAKNVDIYRRASDGDILKHAGMMRKLNDLLGYNDCLRVGEK